MKWSPTVPVSIPSDQAYYWTTQWQEDVKEAMEAIGNGEAIVFDDLNDPNDIVRWLTNE